MDKERSTHKHSTHKHQRDEDLDKDKSRTFPCGVTQNNISRPVSQTIKRRDEDKRINTNRNITMRKENAVPRVSSCMGQKGAGVKKTEIQEKNHYRENVRKSDKPLANEEIKKSDMESITRSSQNKKEEINKTGQERPKFVEGGPSRFFSFYAENRSSMPNKIPKRVAPPFSSAEKRRKLAALQTSLKPVSELKGTVSNPEVKEQRRAHVSSVKAKEKSEASGLKRPHSGLKETGEKILGKRKDHETNGLLYDKGSSRPNKIPKRVVSPLSSVEKRRKVRALRTSLKPVSELKGTVRNAGVKEQRRAHVSSVKAKEKSESSAVKRPHSDLKEKGSCRPNKIPKSVASPLSSMENRTKLGDSQPPSKPVSELKGTVNNPEVKGFIDPQKHKRRSHVSSKKVKEKSESSAKKQPHPDTDYLNQLLLNIPYSMELREPHPDSIILDRLMSMVPERKKLIEYDSEEDDLEWLNDSGGWKSCDDQSTDSNTSLDESLKKQSTDSTTPLDESVKKQSIDSTTVINFNEKAKILPCGTIALPYVVLW